VNEHLNARVIDDATGQPLDGVPTRILFVEAQQTESPVYARHADGCWLRVEHRHMNWHRAMGHDVRLVRVEGGASHG
jgi:hypothetical protein